MGYRECPNHGWLETAEYAVTPSGETICPACEVSVSGFYGDPGSRRGFGGPNHRPREEFQEVCMEFLRRVEDLDTDEDYHDVRPVMDDYEFPENVARNVPEEKL